MSLTQLTQMAALIAVMGTAVVYGTDVFCAMVLRPALARVDDAALGAVTGFVHRYADRRMPGPGVIGVVAAAECDDEVDGLGGEAGEDLVENVRIVGAENRAEADEDGRLARHLLQPVRGRGCVFRPIIYFADEMRRWRDRGLFGMRFQGVREDALQQQCPQAPQALANGQIAAQNFGADKLGQSGPEQGALERP